MNLKTAFRAQNTLKNTIDSIISYLSYTSNVSVVTLVHKKNKAVQTKEDETIVSEKSYDFSTEDIVGALLSLIEEKKMLTEAINVAKKSIDLDIDGVLSLNLIKRKALKSLKSMCNIKESVKTTFGRDYTFNVEGNQVSYMYDIEQTTQPDFDQKELKLLVKELETEVDDLSNKIDELYIETTVEYQPVIGDNDSLEEVLQAIITMNKSTDK